jgi:kexin
MKIQAALVLLLASCLCASAKTKLDWNNHDHFVIQHDPKGRASLAECCNALGVELIEQVGELENHWLVRTQKHLQRKDSEHPVIDTFNLLRRHAINELHKREPTSITSSRVVNSIKMLEKQELRKRVKRELVSPIERRQQGLVGGAVTAYAEKFNITDPIFPTQWHFVNDQYPTHVMIVTGLWEMGITGKGVISAMVDDGLDYESEDLAANFVWFLFLALYHRTNNKFLLGRMPLVRMTSMTMSPYQNQYYGTIIMVLVVQGRLPQSRMMPVESV